MPDFYGRVENDFQPHYKWVGPKPGWVFKRGDKGQGYYRDPMTAHLDPTFGAAPKNVGHMPTDQTFIPGAAGRGAQMTTPAWQAPTEVDQMIAKTLPNGVAWKTARLRVGDEGAGIDMEHCRWGLHITAVEKKPGQEVKPGSVIVGIEQRTLQNLTEGQAIASFKKRLSHNAKILHVPLADLEAAQKFMPDEDGIIEGTDPRSDKKYFYNTKTKKSGWTREEALGETKRLQDNLEAFLSGGMTTAPKPKKRKKPAGSTVDHEEEARKAAALALERQRDWNSNGRGVYTQQMFDKYSQPATRGRGW